MYELARSVPFLRNGVDNVSLELRLSTLFMLLVNVLEKRPCSIWANLGRKKPDERSLALLMLHAAKGRQKGRRSWTNRKRLAFPRQQRWGTRNKAVAAITTAAAAAAALGAPQRLAFVMCVLFGLSPLAFAIHVSWRTKTPLAVADESQAAAAAATATAAVSLHRSAVLAWLPAQ